MTITKDGTSPMTESSTIMTDIDCYPRPLLILSDAITGKSGLARIARDLATNIHQHLPHYFRVGALGVGGTIATSSQFPFYNASIRDLNQMVPGDLPEVWADFAGRVGDGRQPDSPNDLLQRRGQLRHGVLFAIWNASWCRWLADPTTLPAGHPVRDFLLQPPPGMSHRDWSALAQSSPAVYAQLARRPFEKWLYCPVDGHCADGTLGWQIAPVLRGFDRVLAYTNYGAEVIERTLTKWPAMTEEDSRTAVSGRWSGKAVEQKVDETGAVNSIHAAPRDPIFPIPHLPHGIDRTVFYPRDRATARQTLVSRLSNGAKSVPLLDDQFLIIVSATNTPRKDWALAFQTAAELRLRGRNAVLWGHTDHIQAHWNLPALARQFGMEKSVMLTSDRLTDGDLAEGFSAGDAGLHIGAGEGFGYFGPEAVATGLPVVHGNYAGGVEFVPGIGLVGPVGFTTESPYLIQRPVFSAGDWADAVDRVTSAMPGVATALPQPLTWDEIWPGWEKWLTGQNKESGDVE